MDFPSPDPVEARTAAEPAERAEPRSTGPGSPTDVPAENPHSPLLAALGAGEVAVAAVARAFADAFSAAASRQKTVQQRVAELPAELEELRGRFSGEELRRALEAYRVQVERAYAEFAGRGEEAWGRLREQPHVRQAITTLESYTEKLDARVDDAQDAAARALAAAGRQTRVTGDTVARAGQRFSGRAAGAVVDASAAASDAVEAASDGVEEVGISAASAIEDAGDETAAVARKATRAKPEPGPSGTTSAAKPTARPRRAPRRTGPASE